MVERILGKDEVAGSNPAISSKKLSNPIGLLNFLSNPKDWHVITPFGRVCNLRPAQYDITRKRVCFVGLITYNTSC